MLAQLIRNQSQTPHAPAVSQLGVTKLRVARADAGQRIRVESSTLSSTSGSVRQRGYVDVNADGRRDLLDALSIINRLNRQHPTDTALDNLLADDLLADEL